MSLLMIYRLAYVYGKCPHCQKAIADAQTEAAASAMRGNADGYGGSRPHGLRELAAPC